jgi:hypothetical protein
VNDLHERLASAIAAVNDTNTKLVAHDAAIAKLNASIDSVPQHQGAVNALANDDAAAFEAYARGDTDDEPTIDAKAHDKARQALAGAQAKAAAARTALAKIEGERSKVRAYAVKAQSAIYPIATQITLASIVPTLIQETKALREQARAKSTKIDEAVAVLAELTDSLKGSDLQREVSILMTELSTQTRASYEFAPVDAKALRAELMVAVNQTIDNANTQKEAN